jgi:hypothetical protein
MRFSSAASGGWGLEEGRGHSATPHWARHWFNQTTAPGVPECDATKPRGRKAGTEMTVK